MVRSHVSANVHAQPHEAPASLQWARSTWKPLNSAVAFRVVLSFWTCSLTGFKGNLEHQNVVLFTHTH